MLINTHMLIGKKVYDNIEELLNINLDKNYFIYGNMSLNSLG
ncbi:hypothetical protein [Maledivibacter halophilus]|uniref:Uncharacterized protein n=1 Tax=Maledivibacter halophilus TaxID=36842 RepID=A0A1T5LCF4_9FIRM|nr:hypothetical protein [Maledivibacter halophilus]SKC73663.1 hypothetical protein SAMN02194393_02754 [Maledivibacter halophilus]